MAEVERCGHVSCFMDVEHVPQSPQVHLHFLTDEYEHSLTGFWKVELCCHGCGQALLVYYTTPRGRAVGAQAAIRARFERQHRSCPNRRGDRVCLDYRSRVDLLDLRPKKRRWRMT